LCDGRERAASHPLPAPARKQAIGGLPRRFTAHDQLTAAMSVLLVSYPGSEPLGQRLQRALNAGPLSVELRHFPDGEIYLRVLGNVDDKTVLVVCRLDRPNDKVMGLFLLASTLKQLGARRVILIAPYLPYMRQDTAFRSGESISANHFAKFISSAFDALVTVDPHLHRLSNLSAIFDIPAQAVHAAPAIAGWIAENIDRPIIVGPDTESAQWAADVAKLAGCPHTVLSKTRTGDRAVEIALPNVERLRNHTSVLLDDIVSTGRTMIAVAKHIKDAGERPPVCIAVHGIFAGDAYDALLTAGIARVVTCNTVAHTTNDIDVVPLIAQAIARIDDNAR
jgi:ribose-phosphate pyrophosphokinase